MRRIEKPWGYEIVWAETDAYVGKILHLDAGCRLSLQYHQVKEESLLVQSGEVLVTLEQDDGTLSQNELGPGATIHVAPGRRHRFQAVTDCDLIEVSTPELEDVVRISDDYGRVEGEAGDA
ncbi:MAG: cupin domain-containing protein [Deltaproteobacteria bacterium]|nr:cupin domain-containing protein [Deltaproteobacteria bacterium]